LKNAEKGVAVPITKSSQGAHEGLDRFTGTLGQLCGKEGKTLQPKVQRLFTTGQIMRGYLALNT